MERPHRHDVMLYASMQTREWFVFNRMTRKRVQLPDARDGWDLCFNEDGEGSVRAAGRVMALSDVFKRRALEDDDGAVCIHIGGDDCVPLQQYMQKHDERLVKISMDRGISEITAWSFQHPWCGTTIWWSLEDLYEMANTDSSMSSADWMHTWWPWRTKWLDGMNLDSPPHLRVARPTRRASGQSATMEGNLDPRVLDYPSCSSPTLLALLVRMSTTKRARTACLAGVALRWRRCNRAHIGD